MRSLTLLLALAACARSAAPKSEVAPVGPHTELAPDEEPVASYGQAEVQKALIAERAAEATLERELADLDNRDDGDRRHEVVADLGVQRRAIAILERCEVTGRMCPPRLEVPPWNHPVDTDGDPVLEVPLRFDLEGWRKVAGELHWRACGCRTTQCIESVEITIARLETRPMADVQADDVAQTAVVRARECLMRLRGKRALPAVATD